MMMCFNFFKLTIDKISSPLNRPYRSISEEKNLNYLLWQYKEYNWKRQKKISNFILHSTYTCL